jgi:hypothetical protein
MRLVLKRYKESTQLHQDPGSLGSAAGVSQAALVRNLHGRANCPRRAVNDPIDQVKRGDPVSSNENGGPAACDICPFG